MNSNLSRKSFLKVLGLGTAGISLRSGLLLPSPKGFQSVQHVTINKKEREYAAFPLLYHLPDGSLYTEFKSRLIDSKTKPYSKIIRKISTDGGRTWARTHEKKTNPDFRSASGKWVDANAYGWRLTGSQNLKKLELHGVETENSFGDNIRYAYGCYTRMSSNGGKSWDTTEIKVPDQGLMLPYANPCSYLRLNENIVLRSIYGKPRAGIHLYESWLLRSENNGVKWNFLAIGRAANEKVGLGETALVEAENGAIIAIMSSRPSQVWKCLYSASSSDRGKTWTKPVSTGIVGHPGHLLKLKNGHLVITYGYRINRNDPMELRAAFSYDDGRSWDLDQIRILRNDAKGLDIGSPVSIQREDGKIFTNYYMTTKSWGLTQIEGTIWEE